MIKDKLNLLAAFYRASAIELAKSPKNFWIASGVQLFYYIAQALFWVGILSNPAGRELFPKEQLWGFLVTLALADNIYIFLFGQGSVAAARGIISATLEPALLMPRSSLAFFIFSRPNLSYWPCLAISLAVSAAYCWHFHIPCLRIAIYAAAILAGVAVLNAISFLYRLTAFWTSSLIAIRNANPSFKIMVRPYASFGGPLKFALLTLFPALFITAVPAELLAGRKSAFWLGGSLAAAFLLWTYVALMWRIGLKRYGKYAT